MQPLSNQQILRGFNKGEDSARTAVFELYHDTLLIYVRKFTRNFIDAEDLVHDAFTALYEHEGDFAQFGDLRNYLFNTCKNICINDQKKQKLDDKKHAEAHERKSYTDEDFDADIIYSETMTLLFKCIENLPYNMKMVFRLRYFDDLPNGTVAAKLQIAVKTAYNLYSDARKKLKWDLDQIKSFSLYFLNLFL